MSEAGFPFPVAAPAGFLLKGRQPNQGGTTGIQTDLVPAGTRFFCLIAIMF